MDDSNKIDGDNLLGKSQGGVTADAGASKATAAASGGN